MKVALDSSRPMSLKKRERERYQSKVNKERVSRGSVGGQSGVSQTDSPLSLYWSIDGRMSADVRWEKGVGLGRWSREWSDGDGELEGK